VVDLRPVVELDPVADEVDFRPVVVVRRPVVEEEVVRRPEVEDDDDEELEVVELAGQSDRSLIILPSQELSLMGPEPVPSRHLSSFGHQTQKGSRRQLEQEVYRLQSSCMQVSKNHSEQLSALPPGPTAFPTRHSEVDSHQPQLSVWSLVQESQSV